MIAIAIDDEPPALKIISKFCVENDNVELKRTFTNPEEALKYMKKYPVDVLFVDIQMPGHNGLQFFRNLKIKPLVIFTTAYSEYAVEGFNVNAVDYLLKPYTQERFNAAIQKAYDITKAGTAHHAVRSISLRSNYSLTKIPIDDILLVESLDDYLTIYLLSGKKIITRMTLKKIQEMLPEGEFSRVHRSYLLPWKFIERVRNKVIYIGGKEIPIGIKYEKNFNKRFRSQ